MVKIEELVLSIDQMQHLKELGVEVKDTAFAWFPPYKYDADGFPSYLFREKDSYSVAFNDEDEAAIPTLTLQEILEMLPEEIRTDDNDRAFLIYDKADENISYNTEDCDGSLKIEYVSFRYGENILVDAYNALCWCAENGYLNKE